MRPAFRIYKDERGYSQSRYFIQDYKILEVDIKMVSMTINETGAQLARNRILKGWLEEIPPFSAEYNNLLLRYKEILELFRLRID